MSATPPNPPTTNPSPLPAEPHPEWTEADGEAMFASVVWFRERCPPDEVEKYLGMYVAILGEKIIDADRDKDELVRRLEARPDATRPTRVVLEYVPTVEESLRY